MTEAVHLADQIAQIGAVGLMALAVLAIMRGWLVTKVRHDDARDSCERLIQEKEHTIARIEQDRDWWKDATVAALQIGETVSRRDR